MIYDESKVIRMNSKYVKKKNRHENTQSFLKRVERTDFVETANGLERVTSIEVQKARL